MLLEELNFIPGFVFTNDVSYLSFLNRVHDGELKLRAMGLWDAPHPWLNLFVPKSRMLDFDRGVFKGILKQQNSSGPILVYPMNKNKYALMIKSSESEYLQDIMWHTRMLQVG